MAAHQRLEVLRVEANASFSISCDLPSCRVEQVTHSGDSRLARHVGNAILREDARGARLAKERKDSPRRIDAAVAAVMAHDRAASLAGVDRVDIYI